MATIKERAMINRELKNAVERHSPEEERYPKADAEEVVQAVVDAGYDQDAVEDALDELLRVGELYEVPPNELGVV